MRRLLLVLSGSALALTVFASGDWTNCSGVIESEGNLSVSARWEPGASLHLRVATPDTNRLVDLSVSQKDFAIRLLSAAGSFPPDLAERHQFKPDAFPASALTSLPLVLKIRQEEWSLYAGDRFVASLPPALTPPFIVLQPRSEQPAEARSRFQKVADFRFEDSFLRPEGEENPLGEWTAGSGKWYLHTALETALENKVVKPESKRLLQSDFSPNFYSLAGKGTGAVITVGYDFYDRYNYEAGVRTGPGERGLLFACQNSGACHGYTLTMGGEADEAWLSLWSSAGSNHAVRVTLASTVIKTGPGQWLKLRVKLPGNRIECFLDQAKLFDVPADLPPGGQLGLYADTSEEARFDDVVAESTHDLDFHDFQELRRQTLAEEGAFFPRQTWWGSLFSKPVEQRFLAPPVSARPQWLVVGAAAHAPHVFSAEFELTNAESTVGLLAGYTAAEKPYTRFVRQRNAAGERFTLEAVEGNRVRVLEELRLPLKPELAPAGPVRLMIDAATPGEWRMYRNEELVLVHAPAEGGAGASGLFVGPGTAARIGLPLYQGRREGLFLNRYEKNNRYVIDPFMRHWASPEGQWLAETNGLTWYTGDFFGRLSLRMPLVQPSEIHLGVGEGDSTNGEWIIQARAGALSLRPGSDPAALRPPVETASATNLATDAATCTWYKVQAEGRWIWVTSGDRLLFKHSLATPLQGRRIRVAGFTTEQLKSTYVERYNVKDFLFNESLFDWVINGGRWEIVNRFQCDPRWSHMNGEGTNGLAALWAKLALKGDFCIEMHAGQRHGWYERCGDLNLTVMNPDASLGHGYTLTCTGWDPDQSQLFTTLYRNGKLLARSDKYLVPRRREGNKRFGYEPLIANGRDVHGAWYYLKLRRIGKTLELYFDNEKVLSVQDDQPLQGGTAGIWTFMNSIMVARVKVAAEQIAFRPPSVLPASPQATFSPTAAAPAPRENAGLRKDGKPLALCMPSLWEASDPVSRLRLEWPADPKASNWFAARNVMGGGSMETACLLPPVPLEQIAGWRFDVLRTPGAQFNFHYSIGRLSDAGLFVAEQQFVHRISGPDPAKSEWIQSGSTGVPPAPAGQWDPAGKAAWSPVTAWIPGEWPAKNPGVPYFVKVEGFGVLQPAYEMAGLFGNSAADRYAVRDFTEITYAPPRITLPAQAPVPARFSVLESDTGRRLATFTNMAGLQAWAASPGTSGLIRVVLETEPRVGAAAPLAWIRLPAQPAITCSWHGRKPETVALRGAAAYPDPRFQSAGVTIQGVSLAADREEDGTRTVSVPREAAFATGSLSVACSGAVTNTFTLDWKDNPAPGRPVLTRITGATPFLQNGEPRALQTMAAPVNPAGTRLESFDPEQGSFLRVRNTIQGRRLRSQFPVAISLAQYPVFQFKYRTAEEMTRVSLSLGGGRLARISETLASASAVRGGTNLLVDGAWHTWCGQVSDALSDQPFSTAAARVTNPELGSFHSIDQTGLYTRWDLDDLVFGPAVSRPDQLAFTPEFFDFGGVESVAVAVRAGPEAFSDLTAPQAAALAWQPAANAMPVAPRLDGLPDGLCHLFLKARGRSGRESQVSDIPFLLDRSPMKGSFAFGGADLTSPAGALLNVTFDTGGAAPLDPEKLKLKWEQTEIAGGGKGVRLVHQPDRDTLSFVWPQLFRDQLSAATNGQRVSMALTGVRDGAGNDAPDLMIPLAIDYARDHTPPTLLSVRHAATVGWRTSWEPESERNSDFVNRGNATSVELVRATNESPYLLVKAEKDAMLSGKFDKGWSVGAFPYLAFRIRRPVPASNDTVTITLNVDLSTTNTLIVPITARKASPRYSPLAEPLAWRSNEWSSVFLDVAEAARAKGVTNLAGVSVKSLIVRATRADTPPQFEVQNFFAFAPAKTADVVRIEAYDASGMDAPLVEGESAAGQAVAPGFAGNGWRVLRPRDKAGNAGLPIRVPFWGSFVQ
jgi:hypothetical protein